MHSLDFHINGLQHSSILLVLSLVIVKSFSTQMEPSVYLNTAIISFQLCSFSKILPLTHDWAGLSCDRERTCGWSDGGIMVTKALRVNFRTEKETNPYFTVLRATKWLQQTKDSLPCHVVPKWSCGLDRTVLIGFFHYLQTGSSNQMQLLEALTSSFLPKGEMA